MTGKMKWDGRANSRLKKLLAANCTYREIAGILGCSPSAVGGQVHRLGLTTHPENGRRPRAAKFKPKPGDSLEGLFLNGEQLVFSDTGESCARCGVREDAHHNHGCGQFAGELRVRDR